MTRILSTIIALSALLALLSGCQALQKFGRAQADAYARGYLTVLLCNQPQFDGCEAIPGINIAGNTAKLDTPQLPASVGDNRLQSFQVGCGRPTAVVLYEDCNFRGQVAAYHCAPPPGSTVGMVEIPQLGSMAGKVSAIVFSDETRDPALTHTAIPLTDAPAQVGAGITAALTGAGGVDGDRSGYCPLIRQCCDTMGLDSGGSDRPSAVVSVSTEMFWTEGMNVFSELPQPEDESDRLFRVDECLNFPETDPQRKNLLGIVHSMKITAGPNTYPVILSWYLEPKLRNGTLELLPYQTHYRVYSTSFPGSLLDNGPLNWLLNLLDLEPQERLSTGISRAMDSSANALACEILATIKDRGDALLPGVGEAVLTGNSRFTWTFEPTGSAGRIPCNGGRCGNYRSAVPTLILHKK